MKDSSRPPAQSPLGYLTAFTLGIICMGAIVFFSRPRSSSPQSADHPPADAPASPRIHFQRSNSSDDLRESLQLPRASARPIMPVRHRSRAESTTASESPPPEVASIEAPVIAEADPVYTPPRAAVPVAVAGVRDAVPNGGRISG